MTAELEAEALIGDEAEAFMRSDLGRILIGMAQQEAAEAIFALKTANASDAEQLRELQNRIWRAESFEEWLRELIDRGQQAITALQQGTEDE